MGIGHTSFRCMMHAVPSGCGENIAAIFIDPQWKPDVGMLEKNQDQVETEVNDEAGC